MFSPYEFPSIGVGKAEERNWEQGRDEAEQNRQSLRYLDYPSLAEGGRAHSLCRSHPRSNAHKLWIVRPTFPRRVMEVEAGECRVAQTRVLPTPLNSVEFWWAVLRHAVVFCMPSPRIVALLIFSTDYQLSCPSLLGFVASRLTTRTARGSCSN